MNREPNFLYWSIRFHFFSILFSILLSLFISTLKIPLFFGKQHNPFFSNLHQNLVIFRQFQIFYLIFYIMDHYQYRTTTTQAPLSPYNNLPFRATPTERIPIYTFSQPLAPTFHPYYSQTTVYAPARSIQNKVIGPPIACSVI